MSWPTKTEKDRQMTMMIKVTMHLKDIQSYNASRRRLNIARTANAAPCHSKSEGSL